jgi:UDPglucose 6-dehydrogenase
MVKNVCVVGTGYVGLVTGTCLSDLGLNVTCVDNDKKKIDILNRGVCPIYEIGLEELIRRNQAKGRLKFSTNLKEAVVQAEVIFLAVGTPPGKDGYPDTSALEKAAVQVAVYLNGYKVITNKSTAPIGSARRLKQLIKENCRRGIKFDVVANPEFLREGSSVGDFMRPDRLILGSDSQKALKIMKEIYRPLYLIETPFVLTNWESAELIKYATNCYLAAKISFINEMANLCEKTGADVQVVAKAMGLDKRIGPKFLHAGAGFGGSCLPKDLVGLNKISEKLDYRFRIGEAALEVNQERGEVIISKVKELIGNPKGKRIGVLGLSFKPSTDDIREAPAINVIRRLMAQGARVQAYDPAGMKSAQKVLKGISFASDAYDCAKNADCLLLVTEWNEFRELNLESIKKLMKSPNLVDARNVYEPEKVKRLGFAYTSVGR